MSSGQVVAVLGANGAGKSTLLRLFVGLCRTSGGDIKFDGQVITRMSTAQRVRVGITLVPQGYQLFGGMTVEENLLLGGYTRKRGAAFDESLNEVRELFPVLAQRWNQLAGSLSGGERVMLAIGRGLMTKPRVLLLDEPSLGLAPNTRGAMFDSLRSLCLDRELTIIMAEQDVQNALRISHYGYVLQHGQLVDHGSPEDLSSTGLRRAYIGM
jgi:branched-chain amino acid transport system ATP-binding protein